MQSAFEGLEGQIEEKEKTLQKELAVVKRNSKAMEKANAKLRKEYVQGLKKDMEKLKKPEVKSFQSKYMQRKVNLRSAVNDKHQVKKNDMSQTELIKVPDIEEDDDEEDDYEEDKT